MIGTADQERTRSTIVPPSWSGRPRSTTMRSTGRSVAVRNPLSASSASRTVNCSSSKPARKKRLIWTSSSMMSTAGWDLVIDGLELGMRLDGQKDRQQGAATDAGAGGLYLSAAGRHQGAGDPQAKPGAGDTVAVPRTAIEALPHPLQLVGCKPGAVIAHRQPDRLLALLGHDLDGRPRGGILHRVLDQLPERLFDQQRVDLNQWQVVGNRDLERVPVEQPALMLDRRIDDVTGIDPLRVRPDAFVADTGGIEQVLDLVVETFGLLAQDTHERGEPFILGDLRRLRQHRGRTHDGGERR